jgi:hypothetical protein
MKTKCFGPRTGSLARAEQPRVGDLYHKPAHIARTLTGSRQIAASDLVVEAVDHEWVTVSLNGKSSRFLLKQWAHLATQTILNGAQFFPAPDVTPAR